MDDLVLPDPPITDYNTRYSGITADMMAGVTRTLRDAQRSLFSYMGPDTLLVRAGFDCGSTLHHDDKAAHAMRCMLLQHLLRM